MAKCRNCSIADSHATDGDDERAEYLHDSCRGECECTHELLPYEEPRRIKELREEGRLREHLVRGKSPRRPENQKKDKV